MWLMGVNSYDEDIKFQSSHRPQFLTPNASGCQPKHPFFLSEVCDRCYSRKCSHEDALYDRNDKSRSLVLYSVLAGD